MLASLLFLSTYSLDYWVDTEFPYSDDLNDCVIRTIPCPSIITALSHHSSNAASSTISYSGSESISSDLIVDSPLMITGVTCSESSKSTIVSSYSLSVSSTVTLEFLKLSFSLFSIDKSITSTPRVLVNSGDLTLRCVDLFAPQTAYSYISCPVIDARNGFLHLVAATVSDINLIDAPLLAISPTDHFSMSAYSSDDSTYVCEFKNIKRYGGNGTIYTETSNGTI